MVWYYQLLKNFSVCCDPHKDCNIVNETVVEVVIQGVPFFVCVCGLADVGNLISCSSAFFKSSLYIWKCWVHILLNASFKDLSITLLVCLMSEIVQ